MQITFALAALAAFASSAVAAPASCSSSFSGSFEITVVNATVSKRDLMNKVCFILLLSINDKADLNSAKHHPAEQMASSPSHWQTANLLMRRDALDILLQITSFNLTHLLKLVLSQLAVTLLAQTDPSP